MSISFKELTTTFSYDEVHLLKKAVLDSIDAHVHTLSEVVSGDNKYGFREQDILATENNLDILRGLWKKLRNGSSVGRASD